MIFASLPESANVSDYVAWNTLIEMRRWLPDQAPIPKKPETRLRDRLVLSDHGCLVTLKLIKAKQLENLLTILAKERRWTTNDWKMCCQVQAQRVRPRFLTLQ